MKQPWPNGTAIQSLVFDKRVFSARSARSWAASHGFRAGKTEDLLNTIRLRQRQPGQFLDGTFRTIPLDDGVQAIIASPKASSSASSSRQKKSRTKKKVKFDWRDPLGSLWKKLR